MANAGTNCGGGGINVCNVRCPTYKGGIEPSWLQTKVFGEVNGGHAPSRLRDESIDLRFPQPRVRKCIFCRLCLQI
jgi:hypothetical protein